MADVASQTRSEYAEVDAPTHADQLNAHGAGLYYVYIGRAKAHTAPIVSVHFGSRDLTETLISVGEDRYCVEYDLATSSIATGVQCVREVRADGVSLSAHRLELTAKPTAVMWHPRLENDVEDR